MKQATFRFKNGISLTCTKDEIYDILDDLDEEKGMKDGYFIEKNGRFFRAIYVLKTLALKKLGKTVKSARTMYEYADEFRKIGIELVRRTRLEQKEFALVQDSETQFYENRLHNFFQNSEAVFGNKRIDSTFGTFQLCGFFRFTNEGIILKQKDHKLDHESGVAVVLLYRMDETMEIVYCFPVKNLKKFNMSLTTVSAYMMNSAMKFKKGVVPEPGQMQKDGISNLPYFNNIITILNGIAVEEQGILPLGKVYELFLLPVPQEKCEAVAHDVINTAKPLWNSPKVVPRENIGTLAVTVVANAHVYRGFLLSDKTTLRELHNIIQIAFGWNGKCPARFSFYGLPVDVNYDVPLTQVLNNFNHSLEYFCNLKGKEIKLDIILAECEKKEYPDLPRCVFSKGKFGGIYKDIDTINKELQRLKNDTN